MQNHRNSLCRKQWTIMRKQWTVLINAKNRFFEFSKQIRIYSEHDMQRANFINVKTDFIKGKKKKNRLLWNLNMKKYSDLAFKFWKHNFPNNFWNSGFLQQLSENGGIWPFSPRNLRHKGKKMFSTLSETLQNTHIVFFHYPLRTWLSLVVDFFFLS